MLKVMVTNIHVRICQIFGLVIVWCLSVTLLLLLLFNLWTYHPGKLQQPTPVYNESSKPEHIKPGLLQETLYSVSNTPIDFWFQNKDKSLYYKQKSCAPFPDSLDLLYSNTYWQKVYTKDGTFHIFSAHYDNRTLLSKPVVRILGMINRINPKVKTVCQLWFDTQTEPVFSDMEYTHSWKVYWAMGLHGTDQPYLMTCRMPETMKGKIPVGVSIVENNCDKATNILRVQYKALKEKKDFVVCVKGLDFLHKDLSIRLVEWIELLGILGADKVVMYELQANPNISKILQYYVRTGQVEIIPLTLPGNKPNAPHLQRLYLTNRVIEKRKHEIIPYNDCFYRNMNIYKYVVLLDIDEVIIPVSTTSWKELMNKVFDSRKPISSYAVRNVFFLHDLQHEHGWFKDIPQHLYMLQHVYRIKKISDPMYSIKAFHDTQRVLILHNHFPISCFGKCYKFTLDVSDAQLQHYREDCVCNVKYGCEDYHKDLVLDPIIWKHKEGLIKKTETVYEKLGITTKSLRRSTQLAYSDWNSVTLH